MSVVHLEPMFPIASFDPGSECPHYGPLPKYTRFCCMVCHAVGEQFQQQVHQHGEAIGSRIDPDWHADATSYEPGNLKGGKG
jgi:hypothetical protein